MPIKILMPALSPTMTQGNLTKWLKAEGDKVSSGEVIAEIETDKATMEVEAADEGILGKIVVPAGTRAVAVNALIGIILEEGEDKEVIDQFIASNNVSVEKKGADNNQAQTKTLIEEVKRVETVPAKEERMFASPLAKRLAKDKHLDLRQISGSGPRGRIVKNDVINSGSLPKRTARIVPESTILSVSTMREVIAQRLCQSKQQIPHFYLAIDCNIDRLLQVRQEINFASDKDKGDKISVNDMVTKAVAMALKDTPDVNVSWNENATVTQYYNVDISIAVAIKDGLITPIVKNADSKTVLEISREIKQLASKAKEGALMPNEFQGGSITISNLGMYNVKKFSAIVNPPQSAILAIGAGIAMPIVKDNNVVIATMMNITMSCDHRVVDGAVGAKFLAALKAYIEMPARLLI